MLQSLDAYDWAKAFAARHPIVNSGDGRCEDVEELMIGWFANAIMRGWDGHAQRYPDLTEKVAAGEARAAALQQEVAAYKSAYAFVVAEEHQREIELDAAEAAIVSLQAEILRLEALVARGQPSTLPSQGSTANISTGDK